jgi:hypothetical protein
MVTKFNNTFYARPSKFYQNWYFWFENKPSGNPDVPTVPLRPAFDGGNANAKKIFEYEIKSDPLFFVAVRSLSSEQDAVPRQKNAASECPVDFNSSRRPRQKTLPPSVRSISIQRDGHDRAARWYSFTPKNPILEGLGMENILVHFIAIWYFYCIFGIFYARLVFLWPFWYIFPILVCCIKKNLATLYHLKKTKHYFCPGCAIYVHRYAVVSSRVRNYGS